MPIAPWWRCCGPCLGRIEGSPLPPAAPLLTTLPCRNPLWLPIDWIARPICPLCHQALPWRQDSRGESSLCQACRERLDLPAAGLQGVLSLAWWAVGSYSGDLRKQLLRARRQAHAPVVEALADLLAGQVLHQLSAPGERSEKPLLLPIPSWKKKANPLPGLISRRLARRLGWRCVPELLERAHPVLGQHHLNRSMRFANQHQAFRCRNRGEASEGRRHPVLIVADILTSGATAESAALCLGQAGWRVRGLLCLARTPERGSRPGALAHQGNEGGRDLRFASRCGDGPG
ncbi:MAG: ComF family protein [Cyanobacteriota bacterium]